ncbi:MAG: hypothetical protein JSS89_07540 [Bacteroidetes bacterium]|nr:hypothetical protein [Bacteroidota bacterium]
MKYFILAFVVAVHLSTTVSTAHAQTVMNFQRTDCNGTMHDLYADLDAGNVVVLEFFMQGCAPCISSGKQLESMRSTLEASTNAGFSARSISA